MSISDTTENAIMKLIFQATAWGNYADNAATSPQTGVDVGLHTADPGDAGTMSTSAAAYTGNNRVTVARTSGGWSVSANTVNPVANIDFGACTAGSETENFFSTGKTGGGTAAILFSGAVSPAIAVSNGVTPRLTTQTAINID